MLGSQQTLLSLFYPRESSFSSVNSSPMLWVWRLMRVSSYWSSGVGAIPLKGCLVKENNLFFYWRKLKLMLLAYIILWIKKQNKTKQKQKQSKTKQNKNKAKTKTKKPTQNKTKNVIGNFWISVLQITFINLQWNGQLTCLTALTATGENFTCTCSMTPTNNVPIGYFEIFT